MWRLDLTAQTATSNMKGWRQAVIVTYRMLVSSVLLWLQVTEASTVVLAGPATPLIKLDDKHYK